MKIVKKFLAFCRRCKWGENYEKKEKDKDVLLLLVIVHIWVLLILGLLAQGHIRKLEGDEFGKIENGKTVFLNPQGKRILKDKCSVTKGYDCVVTCNGLDFYKENDVDVLYASLEKAKEEHECKLTLNSVTFYQFKLQENWIMPDPNKHVNITKLEIGGGQLTDITNNSFACLPHLKTLTIYNTGIAELTNNSFINMPELTTLELRNNPNLNHVDFGFLQNFKLQTLQVQQLNLSGDATVEFLSNLPGEKKYPSLTSLDLSFNNIGYFPKRILGYYSSSLVQLVISASNVTEFENGTFGMIPKNGKIVVDRNKLERFPQDEYESVVEIVAAFFVKDNKLICDCEMEWLQTFVKDKKKGDYGDFNFTKCDGPEYNHNVPFLEADMCPVVTPTMTPPTTGSGSTEPTEDHTGEATDPTTEPPSEDPTVLPTTESPEVSIICKTFPNSRFRRSLSFSQFRITKRDGITIHLSPRTEDIRLEENDNGEIKITFKDNDTSRSLLYWEDEFLPTNETKINCYTNIKQNNIWMPTTVEPDKNYVFCSFNASDSQINILNCRAFKSNPDYNHQTWLANKMRATAITAVTVSAFVLIIVGASIFYLIVRKKPSLIRGSERVIVVKSHNKAHIVVMPRGHSDSTITGSSKYALTESTTDPSISGDSISTVSYISAIQPTPLEIFRYRVERLQALSWGNRNEEDDGDRTPPPLPPYPVQIYQPQCHERLPPNVDLLFEYEWYTTTTTTTTS